MKYKIILFNKFYEFADGKIIQYDQNNIIRQLYFRFNPTYFFRISLNPNPNIKIENHTECATNLDCLLWLKDYFNNFYKIAYDDHT
jgi:hypothetical protein